MHLVRTLLLIVAVATLAACGGNAGQPAASGGDGTEPRVASGEDAPDASPSDAHDGEDAGDDGHTADAHDDAGFAFGRPADATEADRTIEIRTANELVFDPASVTVSAGETVTFSISNDGDLPHDFVIGDDAAQEEHAAEMAEMGEDMAEEGAEHGDANAVSVPPGDTVELTWTFDGDTDGLRYGCHEPGHYDAGMVGGITVR